MTTTAVISATTAADATVVGSISPGATRSFGATGLTGDEAVVLEHRDSSGSYRPIIHQTADGGSYRADLRRDRTVIILAGPIDYRINKAVTAEAVEVVEYS